MQERQIIFISFQEARDEIIIHSQSLLVEKVSRGGCPTCLNWVSVLDTAVPDPRIRRITTGVTESVTPNCVGEYPADLKKGAQSNAIHPLRVFTETIVLGALAT